MWLMGVSTKPPSLWKHCWTPLFSYTGYSYPSDLNMFSLVAWIFSHKYSEIDFLTGNFVVFIDRPTMRSCSRMFTVSALTCSKRLVWKTFWRRELFTKTCAEGCEKSETVNAKTNYLFLGHFPWQRDHNFNYQNQNMKNMNIIIASKKILFFTIFYGRPYDRNIILHVRSSISKSVSK